MNVSGARAVATAGGRRCGWRDERKSRRGRGRRRRSGSIRTEYVHGSKLIRVTCTRSLHASASAKGTFSIKTLNVLCPTYKRLRVQDDCGCEAASTSSESERESSYESIFMKRQKALISAICLDASSIMCFQEIWTANQNVRGLWENALRQMNNHHYEVFTTERTNGRGDGLMAAISADEFEILASKDCIFNDCGDRVAQAFWLRKRCPKDHSDLDGIRLEDSKFGEFVCMNTHLLFPHNANSSLIRLRESFKMLEFLQSWKAEVDFGNIPIIIAGDFNGSLRGKTLQFLQSQGFVSTCVSGAHEENSSIITHRNHRGEDVGVDHILLLNPEDQLENLAADWKKAVFAMITAKLNETFGICYDADAFNFFDRNSDRVINEDEFHEGLEKLKLTGEGSIGLMSAEIEQLIQRINNNSNSGLITFEDFRKALDVDSMSQAYSIIKEATGIEEWAEWKYVDFSTSYAAPCCTVRPITSRESDAGLELETQPDVTENSDKENMSCSLKVESYDVPALPAHGVWDPKWELSDHVPVTARFRVMEGS